MLRFLNVSFAIASLATMFGTALDWVSKFSRTELMLFAIGFALLAIAFRPNS